VRRSGYIIICLVLFSLLFLIRIREFECLDVLGGGNFFPTI